ncbi:uncharacterized protein LOC143876337 [Tasmannia lanceolata]|uniref:uncharacterized protein LOC143876337 n=1 Tax=Tasmannia lanceolata TaxID=3420 RepID=UPI004062EF2F
MCSNIQLDIQNHSFVTDFFIIALQGADVILGVQWLQGLGPITTDYKSLTMDFVWHGEPVHFQGIQEGQSDFISPTQLHKLADNGGLSSCFILFSSTTNPSEEQLARNSAQQMLPDLQAVLHQFTEVFTEPSSLPPSRPTDHRILLEPNSKHVNIKPYRYPHFQKSGIAKLVNEMLDSGIIQPSSSPFSSPVLLVKKRDGSWRFCVDYRDFVTKDKFPIPTVAELLDELHGATVFSKLDLRAGYHQIRMHPSDIQKTAFRTHDGHFEFLVMPFCLTNAPSTFQATMNQFFKPFLRKFVIIFFDDIFVFSQTLADHVIQLFHVLQTLKTHQLYAKLSKCSFGKHSIEYLGHFISDKGVQPDYKKIESMLSWPRPSNLKQLPTSKEFSVILVVADRFSKSAHFGALPKHYDASKVASLFMNIVCKHHGIPRSLVSDRDLVFLSKFWKTLFQLQSTELRMSSAYNLQTDGQTEVVNRCLEQYLRAFTSGYPTKWYNFLGWAEYHNNTAFHSSLGRSPFEAVFGRLPPNIPAYCRGSTKLEALDQDLGTRTELLHNLKQCLLSAQTRMKAKADVHRTELQFQKGDWVLLKQHYRQVTVGHQPNHKLGKKFFGPFQVIKKIGSVAYKLKLPEGSQIHPVFHISVLKPFYGDPGSIIVPLDLPSISLNNRPVI